MGHESGTLMNGMSALIKGTPERPLASSSREMTAIYEPRSGPSPDTESASALFLDFQPPELRHKCLFFKSSSPWFVIAA